MKKLDITMKIGELTHQLEEMMLLRDAAAADAKASRRVVERLARRLARVLRDPGGQVPHRGATAVDLIARAYKP